LWNSNLDEDQLLSPDALANRAKREFVKDGIELGPSKYVLDYKFNSREWKSELLEVIAKNFFCKTRDGYAEVVTLVGEPKNVQIVKGLFTYLERQIRASRRVAFNMAVEEGRIEYAQQNRRSYWSDKPRALSQFAVHSFKDSFAKGCVATLAKRLSEQQKENITETDKIYNAKRALNPGANLNDVTHSFGNALVAQIFSELDDAYYSFFPDEHPAAVKLREYQRTIEYNKRMQELEVERKAREQRIADGLEDAPAPEAPQKEYKKRGRKPSYRNTTDYSAYSQGRSAGASMTINESLGKGNQTKLNK